MLKSQLSLYVDESGRCVTHYSGFSWLAGIALVVWALQRRLYVIAVFALIYGIAYNVLAVQLDALVQVFLYVVQFFVLGAVANRLHLLLLEKQGWIRTEEESRSSSGNGP
jgi:hypothetical protein